MGKRGVVMRAIAAKGLQMAVNAVPRSMAPGKLHAATHRGNWPSWLTLAGHDAPGCCLASSRVSLPRVAQGCPGGGSPLSSVAAGGCIAVEGRQPLCGPCKWVLGGLDIVLRRRLF